jgi:opacity protein-like surface antigen
MLLRTAMAATAALVVIVAPAAALAQESTRPTPRDSGSVAPDPEGRARLARRGGGLRVGTWSVRGLTSPSSATVSTTPAFEGYVRRGLDLHLAIEHSVGVWRRTQSITETTSNPLGGTTQSTSTLETYIIPQFTSITFFPVTRPGQRFEPYVKAGAGFALGVDDRTGDGGGLFSAEGVSLVPGYGLSGSAGVELRLWNALGLAAAGRYRSFRFFQELSGKRTYEGFGAEVGVTYRFQFR